MNNGVEKREWELKVGRMEEGLVVAWSDPPREMRGIEIADILETRVKSRMEVDNGC